MARKLKGKAPEEVRASKPKVLVFGPPNVGKTWVSLDFPKVYYVDVEGGATQNQYRSKLRSSGGAYFGKEQGSQDFRTVIDEVITLGTVEHDYLTLVIDSFSKLYNLYAAEAEARVGSDFGKDKKEAQKPTRQLLLWLERLDMNVILICHQSDKWVRHGKDLVNEGVKFDGWDKLEYDLELVLHVTGTTNSAARVQKTRLSGFPRDATFRWSFEEFARRAGEEVVLRPPEIFKAAKAEHVAEITHMIGVLKVEPEWVDKCFAKAGVQDWAEMPEAAIVACISHLKSRLTQERTEKVEE